MRREIRICAAASIATLAASPVMGAQVTVTDAWFRELPSGLPAGGYFVLHNAGAGAVELTGAESSACGMLTLHQSLQSGGMSRMQDVASVAVPAGNSVAFAPGGYHLMCMQPAAAMKPGSRVTVMLHFADGSRDEVIFIVRNATGK